MMYVISYATGKIIRDSNSNPITVIQNNDEVLSSLLKEHGPIWLDYEYDFINDRRKIKYDIKL